MPNQTFLKSPEKKVFILFISFHLLYRVLFALEVIELGIQTVKRNKLVKSYRLGRYGEAETYARRAVALSGGRVRLFRQTLAEILHEAGKNSNASNSKEEET